MMEVPMAKILIVLPYSGNQFGGGLAVLNQKLTKALAGQGHEVRLVTMELPDKLMPVPSEHEGAEIIVIRNDESRVMADAGGPKGERHRNRLYELINDENIILEGGLIESIKKGGFSPDIIMGHSRFSGPAAILLKARVFPEAKVEYFLHSFPVEGSALVGYDAYEESSVGREAAARKLKEEAKWMPQADVVVGMGPLITAGALIILQDADVARPRVHEAISGIELKQKYALVEYEPKAVPNLLLCGRGSAPIKGLEDLLLAVRMLWDDGCPVHVDVLWWADREYSNQGYRAFGSDVQGTTDGKAQWVLPGGRELTASRRNMPWLEQVLEEEEMQLEFQTRNVDLTSAQTWIDEMMDIQGIKGELAKLGLERLVTLLKGRSGEAVDETYRAHDATLMPSYIEHFGLVPFESLTHGVPVLCNQVSGAGMFLGDRERFGEWGPPCVVKDFSGSMDDPRDFLVDVPIKAFDKRPRAWARDIKRLVKELEMRFKGARKLREKLTAYTYDDFATALVRAADDKFKGMVTKQGAQGEVIPGR
jgi:glycosyltransferase involved in cell wall biosynthesis